jgi:hypothetical protein
VSPFWVLGIGFAALLAARAVRSSPPEAGSATTTAARRDFHFARTFEATRFQRGNLHTHTTRSDGHNTPEQMIAWYETHGYQFLAITDHNLLSDPTRYATSHGQKFVLIAGEEITMTGAGRQVHVNALCTRSQIPGGVFASKTGALSNAIASVLAQGGVAIVNHPNFDWALSSSEVIAARNAQLLEIASGHPHVHSSGDAKHPSHEALWDQALTAGAHCMGVAVDDAHRIDGSDSPRALPGKAWVEVFADRADAKIICGTLARGDLYASTGVELRRIHVTRTEYLVEPTRSHATVVFIGGGGRELARVVVNPPNTFASYSLKGDEAYVRARVESDRARAWTPAVRVVD